MLFNELNSRRSYFFVCLTVNTVAYFVFLLIKLNVGDQFVAAF